MVSSLQKLAAALGLQTAAGGHIRERTHTQQSTDLKMYPIVNPNNNEHVREGGGEGWGGAVSLLKYSNTQQAT